MIAAHRITTGPSRVLRRLVRKLAKAVALFVTNREIRLSDERTDYLRSLRTSIVPVERQERERTVRLIGRRNQIQGW